ncbi:MAG: hypothetical protein JNN13_06680 [Planctomycetes bacterium]|nr:hypothetical protein [Planctomycetota bacterium]
MQPLPFAITSSLLLACASAQYAMHAVAVTPVGIMSQNHSISVGVPAGAPADALDLQVGGVIELITLKTVADTLPDGATFRVQTNVGVQFAPNTCGTTASTGSYAPGPVALRVTLSGPPGAMGNLSVFAVGAGPSAATRTFAVDVDDDGTLELGASGTLQLPVLLDANGELRLRLAVENSLTQSAPNGSGLAHIIVNFHAQPFATCTITPFGAGCGGTTSTGVEQTLGAMRTLTLLAAGCFAQNPVLSAFGAQDVGPTLPGGCALRTDASLLFLVPADNLGYAAHTLTLPAQATGTLYHQFVPIDLSTLTFRASNGLDITCAP